jgi:hypothetical protein
MRELTLLSIVTALSFVLAGIAAIITLHVTSSTSWAIGVATAVSTTVWAVAGILDAISNHKGIGQASNSTCCEDRSEAVDSQLPVSPCQQPGGNVL